MEKYESAEIVKTEEGRQYHIGLKPDEVARFCLLCGDPARSEKISWVFDEVVLERRNREFVSFTGTYGGIPVTVLSTGIGCDNVEIVLVEYCQLVEDPTFIRIGSCGALRPEIHLGDLIISTGAVKLENTSNFFVTEGYPAVAHHEVVLALIEATSERTLGYHVGLTASASGFYGAQGRKIPGFPIRYPNLPEELEKMRVMNFEMESSALFCLANLRGVRAGTVCAAYANRHHNQFIDSETKAQAELECIKAGLRAVEILHGMDRARGNAKYWYTSLGLQKGGAG